MLKQRWVAAALCRMLVGLSVSAWLPGIAWSAPAAEETQLEAVSREIEKESASGKESAKAETLAEQFNVEASAIRDLRAKNRGWGEISIQLAMAERLSKEQPEQYPSVKEALARVESLRADGRGWGNISRELGFKLGPVVREAKQTRNELRKEARAELPGRPEKTERPAKPERAERPERPEKPERAGKK